MTRFGKVLGWGAVAASLGLGGCAGMMPRFGVGTSPQACASGYSPAAPWHMDRSGGVFTARTRYASMQSRYSLGSKQTSLSLRGSPKLGAGECR
jgi:hypothetical protein